MIPGEARSAFVLSPLPEASSQPVMAFGAERSTALGLIAGVVVGAFVGFLVFAGSASAAGPPASVSVESVSAPLYTSVAVVVTVTDADGQPVPGVTAYLTQTGTTNLGPYPGTTNGDGQIAFQVSGDQAGITRSTPTPTSTMTGSRTTANPMGQGRRPIRDRSIPGDRPRRSTRSRSGDRSTQRRRRLSRLRTAREAPVPGVIRRSAARRPWAPGTSTAATRLTTSSTPPIQWASRRAVPTCSGPTQPRIRSAARAWTGPPQPGLHQRP